MIAMTLIISKRYADLHEFGVGNTVPCCFCCDRHEPVVVSDVTVGSVSRSRSFYPGDLCVDRFNRTDDRGARRVEYLVCAVATGFLALASR